MNQLTRKQSAIITAFTGRLAGTFEAFREYAEELLGRPIMSHEFGNELVWKELKDKSREDFIAIAYKGEE